MGINGNGIGGISGIGTNMTSKMKINIDASINNKQLTTPSQSQSYEYYDTHVFVGDNEISGNHNHGQPGTVINFHIDINM